MRLRRKQVIPERHTEFSPLLFDVLFGLVVFLGVQEIFELRGAPSFLFAALSICIVLHWWLKYKAADETYGLDAGNSALDLIFGLIEVGLLLAAVLAASRGEILHAIFYFTLPLLTESTWALLWRFFGNWRRTSRERVNFMEQQLETTIFLNFAAAGAFGALIANAGMLSTAWIISLFALMYGGYAFLAGYWELTDVKVF